MFGCKLNKSKEIESFLLANRVEELQQFYDHQKKPRKTFTVTYVTADNCKHSSRARGAHFERDCIEATGESYDAIVLL